MPYFPLIVVFCQKYVKNTGIGSLIAMMLPYTVTLLVTWTGLLMLFWAFEWPLGLQASYTMIEEQDEEVGITRRRSSDDRAKPKQQPVIKGVLPDQPAPPAPAPAPKPVAAAPAPVPVCSTGGAAGTT